MELNIILLENESLPFTCLHALLSWRDPRLVSLEEDLPRIGLGPELGAEHVDLVVVLPREHSREYLQCVISCHFTKQESDVLTPVMSFLLCSELMTEMQGAENCVIVKLFHLHGRQAGGADIAKYIFHTLHVCLRACI